MSDEQRAFWNGAAGRSLVAMQERLTTVFAPVSAAIAAAAGFRDGHHVLDVGCGSGDTTLAVAELVGPRGRALGVDISGELLALARRRAAASGSVASFVEGDAASIDLPGPFDHLVSRFGVMFFDDPGQAFANLHRSMKPGGRLTFACWQSPEANPWATVPMRALQSLLPPTPPADRHAPGPFAFADAERVVAMLHQVGWRDAEAIAFDFTMHIGSSADPVADAVDLMLKIGPAARAVREAGPAVESAARAALAAALAQYRVADGVAIPAATWLVTAAA